MYCKALPVTQCYQNVIKQVLWKLMSQHRHVNTLCFFQLIEQHSTNNNRVSHSLQISMQDIESTVGHSCHFTFTNCHVDKHAFLRPGHFFLTISICITVTLSPDFVANRIISTKKPIFMTENGLQHLN